MKFTTKIKKSTSLKLRSGFFLFKEGSSLHHPSDHCQSYPDKFVLLSLRCLIR